MKRLLIWTAGMVMSLLFALPVVAQDEGKFFVGVVKYMPLEDGKSASVVGYMPGDPPSTDVVVPERVTNEGKEYTVTTIGETAFYYSTLTSISIPATITYIGSSAFLYCDDLMKFTCLATTPPTCEPGAFELPKEAVIYVPAGSEGAYKAQEVWKDLTIEALPPAPATTHVITFEQPKVGGTFEVKNGDAAITTGTEIEEGIELTIETAADPDYEVDKVMAGTQVLTANAAGDYVFKVTADTEIKVTFKAVTTFEVSMEPPTNGTFEVYHGTKKLALPTIVNKGTELTIKATPAKDFEVDKVMAGAEALTKNGEGNYTFTVNDDTEIKVTFKEKAAGPVVKFAVNFNEAPEGGTVTVKNADTPINSGDQIEEGTELTIEATASTGYTLTSVKVNDTDLDITKPMTFKVTAKVDIVVVFTADAPAPAPLTVTIPEVKNATLTVTKGGAALKDKAEVKTGDELVITLTPNKGFKQKTLKVNSTDFKSGDTFTVTDASVVIEAEVEADATPLTVTIPKVENATLTVTRGGNALTNGDEVAKDDQLVITLTPAKGFKEKLLTVNGTDFKSGDTFTVTDANVEIEAEVEADAPTPAPLTVTIPEVKNATLTVTKGGAALKDKEEVKEGDKLVITLTPAKGYKAKSLKVNGKDHTSGAEYTVGKENVVIAAEVEADKSTPVDAERMFHYVVKTQGLEVTVEGVAGQSVRFVNVMGNVLFAVPQAANNAVTLRAPQAGIYIIQVGKATRVVSLQ